MSTLSFYFKSNFYTVFYTVFLNFFKMIDSRRSIVVVTGSSRGIGREIAVQVASKISKDSTVVLVARTLSGLQQTKQDIQNVAGVNVETIVADFESNDTKYANEIANIVSQHAKDAKLVALFHNAGTVGDLTKRSEQLNCGEDWHKYLQTNLVSTILLNNAVYSAVQDRIHAKELEFLVIDITSLLAIKAFPSFTQYAIAKASREAFFRAFALENNNVRVLSYSPGPVQTDMRTEVAKQSYAEEIRSAFSDDGPTDASRTVLTPTQTVSRLMAIIQDGKFESGSRVDYFDQ
ncbi:hypothetical protein M3Y97_00394100 [Aphelenchoides bicaudatus]|nr:hypothetical protein M3Y97_00394100 [Aphelenchoides bicaudatus]